MLRRIRLLLARPLAEDFRFNNQVWLSMQAGLYVFLFIFFFGGVGYAGHFSRLTLLAFFGLSVAVTTLLANALIPALFPSAYDEDRWTVGKHALYVLLVLGCVSLGNQLVLLLTGSGYPPFWQMYGMVTVIGFFPITVGVFIAEQRRLERNLAHARTLNAQLDKLHQPAPAPTGPTLPQGVMLTAENGTEQPRRLPNQLVYIESVGNYVDVHWLNLMFPQKTVLRSTLKEMEAAFSRPSAVFRCHRAFIVNLKAVNKTEGNARAYHLTMSGSGQPIPVSRGYVGAFDARMNTLA